MTTHVASIFIRDGIIENELAFLEDFLGEVYRQLTGFGRDAGSSSSRMYTRYSNAQRTGRRAAVRVDLIAQALQQRVAEIRETHGSFLVIDNIDQCSPSLEELLQCELSNLRSRGLNIMITSRLPRYEKIEDISCDFHECGPYEQDLEFYWRCESCEMQYICETCFSLDNVCNRWYVCRRSSSRRDTDVFSNSGADTFWVEPDHFDLNINSVSERNMRKFIAWDLEREHGDLGLGSSAHRPPLSSFGVAFRKAYPQSTGGEWVQEIFRSVNGSILQARLALDRIHDAPSPDVVDFSPHHIPPNVQAVFNVAINNIAQQPASQRELAMKCIAALGKDGEEDSGISVNRLAGLIKGRSYSSRSQHNPPRSVEDILRATKGYLTLMAPGDGQKEYTVVAYNKRFFHYANEEYNDEIMMAKAQLRTSNIPRSFTMKDIASPEPAWLDFLGDLKRFDSPKLLASSARKSSSIRRETSGLMRSQTLLTASASRVTSPSVGLGLDC